MSKYLRRIRRFRRARGRRGGREILVFLGAYAIYNAARWAFTGDLSPARGHADWVMQVEHSTGLSVEGTVQRCLSSGLWTALLSNVYPAAQLLVLPGSLVVLYRRAPDVYRHLRSTILATWLIAVPIFASFPVAPPRLAGIGMVDTVSPQTGVGLTGRSTLFYNPLAAVPSLHVGFAFAIGIAAAAALRAPGAKALALLWGPLVCLAVVVTGNHYVFDIAAGLIVTAIGYAITRPIPRGRRRGVLVHVRLADAAQGDPVRERRGLP